MSTLYLCGAGNPEGVRLALRINHEQVRWDRIVVLDDDPHKWGKSILGVEIIGPFAYLEKADANSSEVVNLITRSSVKRWLARGKIEQYGLPFATLIHPNVDTNGAELGKGVTAYQNSIIGPEAFIDDGSVIFMGAAAGHECHLARGCILAPNAVVNARVKLGDGAYVGTNAAIMPEVNIGAWVTIGACSAVIRDVPTGATVMGVPSKIVMTLKQKLKSEVDETLPPDIRNEMNSDG
ncbi:acetyltransferase [Planctomycetota bacterium]